MHLAISGNGVVAQLAERYLCKVKDEGSNPFGSTIELGCTQKNSIRQINRKVEAM